MGFYVQLRSTRSRPVAPRGGQGELSSALGPKAENQHRSSPCPATPGQFCALTLGDVLGALHRGFVAGAGCVNREQRGLGLCPLHQQFGDCSPPWTICLCCFFPCSKGHIWLCSSRGASPELPAAICAAHTNSTVPPKKDNTFHLLTALKIITELVISSSAAAFDQMGETKKKRPCATKGKEEEHCLCHTFQLLFSSASQGGAAGRKWCGAFGFLI